MNLIKKTLCIGFFALLAGCSTNTHTDIKPASLVALENSNSELRMQNERMQQEISATDNEVTRLQQLAIARQAPAVTAPVASAPVDKLWVRINFKSGRSSVLPETRKTLKNIAGKFLANPGNYRLAILGYSDAEPIGGYKRSHRPVHHFKTLNDLSQARADAVASVMIKAGIPAYKVSAAGMGATDFIGDNNTKEGRSMNRRVEIHLISN
ncbi:MAG: OmpA family protein [Mariprofundus sp.]